jgi:serine/threonine-protein kinase RsbT
MNKIVEDLFFDLSEPSDNAHVVFSARRMLAQIGFDETQQYLIAAAVSELSTNIIRYAAPGNITMKIIRQDNKMGFEVIARDQGKGIENIPKALMENYSTGKGLGLGLPSVKRIMDEFDIRSTVEKGTRIIAKKWME